MTATGKKRFSLFRSVSAGASTFHIDVDRVGRGISVMASGVFGVEEFAEGEAVLRLSGMRIKISGRGLSLTVFENKSVEIVGDINLLEYVYDKTR